MGNIVKRRTKGANYTNLKTHCSKKLNITLRGSISTADFLVLTGLKSAAMLCEIFFLISKQPDPNQKVLRGHPN